MRKLFWCCVAGGVFVVAAVFTLAQMAVRQPDSSLGGMFYRVSRVAYVLNPLSCPKQTADSTLCSPMPITGSEEPAEVFEEEETPLFRTVESILVENTPSGMPIFIPEEEPIPAAAMPVLPDTLCPVQHVQSYEELACPDSDYAQVRPQRMPYCDEEDDVPLLFPAELANDTLPMPRIEGDSEEQEETDPECPLGSAGTLLRLFEQFFKKELASPPSETPSECPGIVLPQPEHGQPSQPTCPGCPGMTPRQSTLPSSSPAPSVPPDASHQETLPSLRKESRWLKTRIDQFCPSTHQVDTMEHRASDRPLSDFGPGPL